MKRIDSSEPCGNFTSDFLHVTESRECRQDEQTMVLSMAAVAERVLLGSFSSENRLRSMKPAEKD